MSSKVLGFCRVAHSPSPSSSPIEGEESLLPSPLTGGLISSPSPLTGEGWGEGALGFGESFCLFGIG